MARDRGAPAGARRARVVTDASAAVVREIGATVRALLWPGAIVGLAVLFRGSLATLLGRASAVSVTTPVGGVSIAARVVGLLASADAARAQARAIGVRSAADGLLWIDDRPDGGQAERAALAAVGIAAAVVSRLEDAGAPPSRVTVIAGTLVADAARASSMRPDGALVLYPEPGTNPTAPAGREVAVCRDAATLFVTIASRFG